MLNRNVRNPDVLRTVLARFGCCSLHDVDKTVQQLINSGETATHGGHRVRLMAADTIQVSKEMNS